MSWRDIQDRAIVSMSIVLGRISACSDFGIVWLSGLARLCVRARVANAKELYRVSWCPSIAKAHY